MTIAPRRDAPVEPPGPERETAGTALQELLSSYRPPGGHYDELLDGARRLRRHWQSFAQHAGDLSAAQLSRRQARVARQIHDDGITYNVYAAADGPTRPWALDVLPALIPAEEWEPLARALRQRARLLDAMAADFAGDRRLLTGGFVPPALVLAHPGFLRPCHGVVPPGGTFLHQLAFDLTRGPDGQWSVVGTRAQAPSGTGYALENRITLSRLFPDAFRELRVHMLAQFFRALQETLVASAPADGETPHVAVLTPGPYNETYFEHVYLARYLGFTLVEGGDLVVRDDRVYLKTLTGLRRVHAILRRLDDDFCDPLELRADSTLGVPGLVQSWRAGNVLIANAFGASVLESPALLGYLDAVSAELLGEPLLIPSAATWWCGDRAALDAAAPRLEDVVIKPASPDLRLEPVFVGDLDPAGRAEWLARLRAEPAAFVLQRYLPLSHAPVWHGGRLESRSLMLRVFLVADGRGDYRVMPGGLTRIAGDDRHAVSGQRGGSSKDTWVLSESPVETFSLLPGRVRAADIAKSQRMVSSRAGENLFWLGRYAERSEHCARLLRAVLARLPDRDAFPTGPSWPVIRTCQSHGLLRGAPREYVGAPHRLERDLIDGMFDRRGRFSLAFNLERTARVAGAVRDRLSADNWRAVSQLYGAFALPVEPAAGLIEVLDLVDQAIVSLVAMGGFETGHMTRDDGWRFLSIGRSVERLVAVTTTIGEVASSADAEQPALLDWLLDASDSTITYRARYMRQPEWLPVAHLLLFDHKNPRSAAFQFARLARQASLLPEADLGELMAGLAQARADCRAVRRASGDAFARPRAVVETVREWEALALRLSDAVTLRYFSHVYEPTQATAVI